MRELTVPGSKRASQYGPGTSSFPLTQPKKEASSDAMRLDRFLERAVLLRQANRALVRRKLLCDTVHPDDFLSRSCECGLLGLCWRHPFYG